jgi:tetratricopeptide (TPR) repeat protein
VLDPLSKASHFDLGWALLAARRYAEAVASFDEVIVLDPDDFVVSALRGVALYALGNLQGARASCEVKPDNSEDAHVCLAVIYEKLGRHADAEAVLAKMKASRGDEAAAQYADIYAQWGDTSKALQGLETALRLRDSGLEDLKTDLFLDPLRTEARYQTIERALKFPPH